MTPWDLWRHRTRLGMTQEEFAARLGVSQTTISRWESGETPIVRPRLVLAAIEHLECPPPVEASPADLQDAPGMLSTPEPDEGCCQRPETEHCTSDRHDGCAMLAHHEYKGAGAAATAPAGETERKRARGVPTDNIGLGRGNVKRE